MKKITLRLFAFIAVALFSYQAQAQANFTGNGIYKISTSGLTPNLYMTVNLSTGAIEWQEEILPDDETQLFTITDHRTPASPGLVEITGTITGLGAFTMAVADDSVHPNVTFIARPGDPVSVVVGSEDYTGLDQFQRRKARVNSDGLADPNGANPPGNPNNNALFVRTPSGTNARYGVVPAAVGEVVQYDGGGIDVIQFHLQQLLSSSDFDTSSIFVSNPVNNELTIKGLTSSVNRVAVYSLIGQEMLSRELSGETSLSLDTSGLSSGVYIVEMKGENGSVSKKIVKQ